MPTRLGGSRGMSCSPRALISSAPMPEPVAAGCSGVGAGGRVTGRRGGWGGGEGGGGQGRGAPHRSRWGSADGRPEPAPPAGRWGRVAARGGGGAARPGAGRRAGLGLGVWPRGGVWGPAGGAGAAGLGTSHTTLACLLQRPWGGMTQGWGAPGTAGLVGSCALESRKTISPRGAGSAYIWSHCLFLSHLLCASAALAPFGSGS